MRTLVYEMNETKVTWQISNIPPKYMKNENKFYIFFGVLQLSSALFVSKTQKLLKSYQIKFLQYVALSYK